LVLAWVEMEGEGTESPAGVRHLSSGAVRALGFPGYRGFHKGWSNCRDLGLLVFSILGV